MRKLSIFLILSLCLSSITGHNCPATTPPYTVGVLEAPPFASYSPLKGWEGLSISVWDYIAKKANIPYRLKSYPTEEALITSSCDIVIGAMPYAINLSNDFTFSIPFYQSPLHFIFYDPSSFLKNLYTILKNMLSFDFLYYALSILFVLGLFSALLWFVEFRRTFPQKTLHQGFGQSLWFALASATTVGYGDIVPKKFWGRFFTLIWIVISLILISNVLATTTTLLTKQHIQMSPVSVKHLNSSLIGIVKNASLETLLLKHSLPYKEFSTLDEVLDSLKKGEIDVALSIASEIQPHLKQSRPKNLRIVPSGFPALLYGILIRTTTIDIRKLNKEILQYIETIDWKKAQHQYLQGRMP